MKTIIAISAIAIIGLACLHSGLDGQLIALAMIAISGLAGYELRGNTND